MTADYVELGLNASKEEEFVAAGDYYTQGAYQALTQDAIKQGNDHQIGAGLESLLRAALSYRRATHHERCRNRCKQGILITEDLQQYVVDDVKRQAVLQEYIADFHGLGDCDGTDQAYQETLDRLEDTGLEYTISFHSSPISDRIIGFTRYLVELGQKPPDEGLELPYDFSGRVAYKRANISEILESLTEDDDGSTT